LYFIDQGQVPYAHKGVKRGINPHTHAVLEQWRHLFVAKQ